MSQPDLTDRLRESRPMAPAELREHVRRIAAQAPTGTPEPSRRFTLPRLSLRRALAVAVPLAAAAVAAVVLLPGNGNRPGGGTQTVSFAEIPPTESAAGASADTLAPTARKASPPLSASVPGPSRTRLQNYSASLELHVANGAAVSRATNKALQIATALHGYLTTVNVNTSGRNGYATLAIRVPVGNVQAAVRRLSALGQVIGENVSIKDAQGKVDATDRLIARLQDRLAALRAVPQTDLTAKEIAAITVQIRHLRVGKAGTVRTAQMATVRLQLTSERAAQPVVHHGHGPLHELGVIFRDAGIGAVYALALGAPLALLLALGWWIARTARRRREERLLSAS